ncbi:MAG: AEC family transporter [Alphaproteobacteria bacterium]|nr:AEC family transporter [Alphaproteobacteria bacterium]
MTLLLATVGLLLPVLLGVGAGAVRLFDAPDAAVDHLNRFALYIGFPALIVVGLASGTAPLPRSPVFWLVVPVALAVALAPLRAVGRAVGASGGTLALVTSFGNVAYLGLPVVARVLGDAALAEASLVVGVYVLLSMTVGPVLLLSWSGRDGSTALGTSVRTVARQPLAWAPIVGVACRALPLGTRQAVAALLAPLGAAAAPVALFLLGLYLHTHAGRVGRPDRVVLAHVVAKGVWLPLVTAALVAAGLAWDGLTPMAARVIVLLSAMPPAITTFAIARELEVDEGRVAQAIVAGTLASAVTIPVVAALLGWMLPAS